MSDAKAANLFYNTPQSIVDGYRGRLSGSAETLRNHYGFTSTEADARLAEDAEFLDAGELGFAASKLHGLMVRHEINPPDDSTREEWSTQTWKHLRDSYGDDAERRLEQINDFLYARPAVLGRLEASGMNSHPDLVAALAANSHRLRITPVRPAPAPRDERGRFTNDRNRAPANAFYGSTRR